MRSFIPHRNNQRGNRDRGLLPGADAAFSFVEIVITLAIVAVIMLVVIFFVWHRVVHPF